MQHTNPVVDVASKASGRTSRGDVARLAGLLLMLATVSVLAATTDLSRLLDAVRDAGPAAAVAFLLVYAGCSLAGVPRHTLSTTTGVVFGLGWGLPVAYLGSLLGAAVAFWVARTLGRGAVARIGGPRMVAFNEALARRGFWAVLGARLTPVLPFTAVNYAAGVSEIDKRTYGAGTLIGVIPGTIGYVALGALATAPGPWMVPVASAVLLLACAVYLARRRARVSRADVEDSALRHPSAATEA